MVEYKYDAWGNHTVSGSNTTLGNLNPFRYRSYFYDAETKLYYLQTRYYDPSLGRFLNMDSVQYANPEAVNGLNLYVYCANNPVKYVDPTGEGFFIFLLIALGIIFTGASVGAVSAAVNGENVGEGFKNGAVVTSMYLTSAFLLYGGVRAPMASNVGGSMLRGAGIGSAFSLSINLYNQLQNGGFGKLNLKAAADSWEIGLGIGAAAGGMSYGGKMIGSYFGGMLGTALGGKSIMGVPFWKIIGNSILPNIGTFAGGLIGGYVAGSLINNSATSIGWQSQNIPLWMGSLLNLIISKI